MKSKLLSNPLVWIIFGAFLLRMFGLTWGLPNELRNFSLHPDEQVNLLYARQINPFQFDFAPGNYSYGTLYLTILRLGSDFVLALIGGVDPAGNISPGAMGQIHLFGRFLNCIFGAGVVGLTFGISRRVLSMPGAYISAAIVSVAPALLIHSRFQTVDMLATMLAVATVYACIRLIEPEAPAMKWAVLAGLFAGMSAGTKYVGIVALVALVPAVLAIKRPSLVLVAGLVAIASFVVTTPGCIVDTDNFVKGFLFELNHSKDGHGVVFMGTPPAWFYHINNLSLGSSILTVILGLSGLVAALAKKSTWAMILCSFFLIYYLAINVKASGALMPIKPSKPPSHVANGA